jgi:hypothetical protein
MLTGELDDLAIAVGGPFVLTANLVHHTLCRASGPSVASGKSKLGSFGIMSLVMLPIMRTSPTSAPGVDTRYLGRTAVQEDNYSETPRRSPSRWVNPGSSVTCDRSSGETLVSARQSPFISWTAALLTKPCNTKESSSLSESKRIP